jgi:hypothetical protein
MGEYRFATGFLILFYWGLAEALAWVWTLAWPLRGLAPALLGLLLLESASVHALRTRSFTERPTVPLARIAEFAERATMASPPRWERGRIRFSLPTSGGCCSTRTCTSTTSPASATARSRVR